MLLNPSDSQHPFLQYSGILAFAHRGGTQVAPENSMAAFQHAVDLGYRYLETDVHATADGVVIAFHDDVLDRVTDQSGRISELPWSEVSQARIDGSEPIPTLNELLETFPEARFNIDAKNDQVVNGLAEILLKANALNRVCLAAFSDRRLRKLRKLLGPDLCTSAGPLSIAAFRIESLSFCRASFSWQCLQVPVRSMGLPLVDRHFLSTAHEKRLQVHVWTINEPNEMNDLLDLGVDGIMTDSPKLLQTVLQERGLWS